MKPSTHGPVRRNFGKTPPPICIFGEDSTLVLDSCHADEMFDSFILDRFGKSALHFAAIDGDIDQVERLLDLSPHLVGILDSEGKTALHYAVVNGHEQVVEELLDANPILIRGVDAGGMNALHYAVDSGHGDIVALLLEESPELITTVDACGWSALHFAASKGFEAIVTQLLDISPSLAQACDRRGKIALHLAANNGHGKVVKALLSASPTTAVDWQGSTALHCAAKKGRKAIITTLLAWNLDMVCSRDRDGNTPLHLAVRAGDVRKSVLTLLYERGPSTLHMVNKQLQSPFHVAVAEENDIAIRAFQQKLSVDEILSAVTMYDKKDYYLTRFKLALLTPCKSLEEWLNEDVANIVYRYVFATPRYHIHLPPNNGTLLDSEE